MHDRVAPVQPMEWNNHIGGRSVATASRFVSRDPATGETVGRFADSGPAEIDAAVSAAAAAFRAWSRLSPTRRGRLLMRWGDGIAAHAEEIAQIDTRQNGRLYADMLAQARAAQDWLYYYGGLADKIEGSVIPVDRAEVLNYSVIEPLGVVGLIIPWNGPTMAMITAVAPALAAGNTTVVKPSELTSASAIRLAELAEEAGLPAGVLNVVSGGRQAGEAIVDHPGIAKLCFIGSDAVGREVAERAGKRLVECTLELGGKSPNIVFADADLARAEAGILTGIFGAVGQSCTAGSRVFVERPVYAELASRLADRAGAIRIGDPFDPRSQIGPVASAAQLARIERMVGRAVGEGATLLAGGRRLTDRPFDRGFFYPATIVAGAAPDSFIMQNEVFGPVMCIVAFDSEEEATRLANDTRYGLAAGVWTKDLARAHRMAGALDAGTVWINTYRAVSFAAPTGGFKDSGTGKLNGMAAMQSFVRTKNVWCDLSDRFADPFPRD